MKRCGDDVERRSSVSIRLRPPTVWLASTSTLRTGSSRRSTTTCSTGRPRPLLDALDEVAAQHARARIQVGGDDDLVGAPLAHRVLQREVGIGVHHLAARLDAHLVQALRGSARAARGRPSARCRRRSRTRAAAVFCGHTTVQRIGPRAARRSIASISFWPPTVSLATTSDVGRRSCAGCRLRAASTSLPMRAVRRCRGRCSPAAACPSPPPSAPTGDLLAVAVQDRVHRAGDAVLVRAADDLRDLVEVEDRRRRGNLPLERARPPRVAGGAGPAGPARR